MIGTELAGARKKCATLSLDKRLFLWYIIVMKTIMISPTSKASQRTKNRIRENGPVFRVDSEEKTQWLLRAGISFHGIVWMGWLPRKEFHVELIDSAVDKFVIDNA